jgi:D-sedoheptulose 7-phosphate isomerase
MPTPLLDRALEEWTALLPRLRELEPVLQRLGALMMQTWNHDGRVLICGNGGSACDAMHFAEELCVRFEKNRRAVSAMALLDPGVLTCCGNDLGFERIFARQVEAHGRAGDVLIVLTTSGNSANLLTAVETAKERKLSTVAFLGKGGGKLKGQCDIELLIPSDNTARIQEAHKLLFHELCRWVEGQL